MLNLVHIRNSQAVTSSHTVAEVFEKRHDHVLRDIRKLRTEINDANSKAPMFIESTYKSREITKPEFLITLEGFRLLASTYTGRRSRRIKRGIIQDSIRSQEKTYAELTPINEVMMRFLNDIRFLSSIGENDETKTINSIITLVAKNRNIDETEFRKQCAGIFTPLDIKKECQSSEDN